MSESKRVMIEYSWNEISETGEFTYADEHDDDNPELYSTESKPQPLTIEYNDYETNRQKYWGELLFHLRTQNEGQASV